MAQGQRRGNTITGQFGDTTYTKIFVGGLAWETQKDTMRRYFEQFGEILEAVVITDKATGRSKGYGFVTFKDADSAARACQNPSPVIDGRRTNCNLASIGARPSRPATPRRGGGRYRITTGSSGAPALYPTGTSYPQQPQYPLYHTFPYQTYGYTGYSQEGMYPMSYYNPHGSHQLSHYYPGLQMVPNAAIYPYYTQQAQSSMHYQHMPQYSPYQQQYPSPVLSIPTNLQPTIAGGVPVNSGAAVSSSSSQ